MKFKKLASGTVRKEREKKRKVFALLRKDKMDPLRKKRGERAQGLFAERKKGGTPILLQEEGKGRKEKETFH